MPVSLSAFSLIRGIFLEIPGTEMQWDGRLVLGLGMDVEVEFGCYFFQENSGMGWDGMGMVGMGMDGMD